MPTVVITQSPRSSKLKRRLLAAITNAFVEHYSVPADQVHIHFLELDDESWGRGGKLAIDFPEHRPGKDGR